MTGTKPLPSKDKDSKDAKEKNLKELLGNLSKMFGANTLIRLGDQLHTAADEEYISTGSLGLDMALGIDTNNNPKGMPMGRICEIFGPESSGKTTLTLHVIAEAQRKGKLCAFIDTEHAFDRNYARILGVDVDNLLFSQPEHAEQALEITDALVRSGSVNVIVVDSVAAMVPKAELEGDMGDSHMALQARLMSQALRKITGSVSQHKCLVIFINQIRSKIGVVFGSPETTTGGNALKFYSSIRLDIRRTGSATIKNKQSFGSKDENTVTGSETLVKVVKNKISAPFKTARFVIEYNAGISKALECIHLGECLGLITKAGSWYQYEGHKFQGKEGMKQMLNKNPEMLNELAKKICKTYVSKGVDDISVLNEDKDNNIDEKEDLDNEDALLNGATAV